MIAEASAGGSATSATAVSAASGEAKPLETKPVETKIAEAKPAEAKPAEPKPAETKPTDSKPTESKTAETKTVAANGAAGAASASAASASAGDAAKTPEKSDGGASASAGGGTGGGSKPPSSSTPPTAKSGGSSSGGLVSGVIGGVIGAVGAIILAPMLSGILPATMALVPEARLQEQVSQGTAAFSSQSETLSGEIADARAALEAAQAEIAAIRAEIETVETARTTSETAQEDARATLQTQIDALNQATAQRESDRADTLATLRDQVSALAAAIAATPAPGETDGGESNAATVTRVALLEGAIRRLDARVNGLSAEALPTPDLSRLDILETRIRALEARPVAAAGDAALGVAFAGLAQALAGSAPYETELETLEKVAGVEVTSDLGDPAANGLPSVISLASRFKSASVAGLEAVARDAAANSEADWTEQLTSRLSALVVVRRTDEIEGDAPDAVMSRAQARLDEGDLEAAMLEVDALPQVALDAMADWVRDARSRAGAEQAFAELKDTLLSGE